MKLRTHNQTQNIIHICHCTTSINRTFSSSDKRCCGFADERHHSKEDSPRENEKRALIYFFYTKNVSLFSLVFWQAHWKHQHFFWTHTHTCNSFMHKTPEYSVVNKTLYEINTKICLILLRQCINVISLNFCLENKWTLSYVSTLYNNLPLCIVNLILNIMAILLNKSGHIFLNLKFHKPWSIIKFFFFLNISLRRRTVSFYTDSGWARPTDCLPSCGVG